MNTLFMDEKASWGPIGGYGYSSLNPISGWGNPPIETQGWKRHSVLFSMFMDDNISYWDPNGGCRNSSLNPISGWGNPPRTSGWNLHSVIFPCLWMTIFPTGNLMVDVEIPFWSLLVDEKKPPKNPRVDETVSNFLCLWMRIFPTGP